MDSETGYPDLGGASITCKYISSSIYYWGIDKKIAPLTISCLTVSKVIFVTKSAPGCRKGTVHVYSNHANIFSHWIIVPVSHQLLAIYLPTLKGQSPCWYLISSTCEPLCSLPVGTLYVKYSKGIYLVKRQDVALYKLFPKFDKKLRFIWHEAVGTCVSCKRQSLGQAIHQHLHKRKFPLMQAERLVSYISRCPVRSIHLQPPLVIVCTPSACMINWAAVDLSIHVFLSWNHFQ